MTNETKRIYEICMAHSPIFYKRMTADEVKKEIELIEFATTKVESKILEIMLNVATEYWERRKAENPKLVFGINYIMEQENDARFLERRGVKSWHGLEDALKMNDFDDLDL